MKKKTLRSTLDAASNGWRSMDTAQKVFYMAVVVIAFVGLLLLMTHMKEFFSVQNLRNILVEVSAYAIMTFGISFVLITAGIDISIAAVLSFSSVVGAYVMQATGNIPLGVLSIFGASILCGAVNGLAISRFKMPAFVVTMAMMIVSDAVGTILSNSRTIVVPPGFRWLATGTILYIPVPIWILVLVGLFCHIILSHTVFGRWVYAVGVNPLATSICSIPTKTVVFGVYVISAFLSSIAGIILTARLGAASLATTSDTTTLDVLCSAIIGGVSIYGGTGKIYGAFFGALFVLVFQNIMNLFGVDYFVSMMVRCGVILLASLGDTIISKNRR